MVMTATALLLVLHGAWQLYAHSRTEVYNSDSSTYQGLALNLIERHAYEFNSKRHTSYPPGFPLLLAAWALLFGGSYDRFVLVNPLCTTLALLLALSLLRQVESSRVAAAAILWLAASPHLFVLSTRYVLSDLPYFAVTMAALLLGLRLDSAVGRWRIACIVGFALLTAAAVAVRLVGVALLAAAVATALTLILRCDPSARRVLPGLAAGAASAAATVGLWIIWVKGNATPEWAGDYTQSYFSLIPMKDPYNPLLGQVALADLLQRALRNTATQMAHVSELLIPSIWVDRVWFSPLILIPLFLTASGLAHSILTSQLLLMAWYVLAYLGIYALWPFDEGPRFILPVFPLILVFAWRGSRLLAQAVRTSSRVHAILAASLALLAVAAAWWHAATEASGLRASLWLVFWLAAASVTFAAYLWRPAALAIAHRHSRAAGAVALVTAVLAGLAAQAEIARDNLQAGRPMAFHRRTVAAAEWLRSAEQGTVMGRQAAILHRLTGRRVVSFPPSTDGHVIAEAAQRYSVVYLVVNDPTHADRLVPSEQDRLKALLAASPECCRLIHSGEGYRIYRTSFGSRAATQHPRPAT